VFFYFFIKFNLAKVVFFYFNLFNEKVHEVKKFFIIK